MRPCLLQINAIAPSLKAALSCALRVVTFRSQYPYLEYSPRTLSILLAVLFFTPFVHGLWLWGDRTPFSMPILIGALALYAALCAYFFHRKKRTAETGTLLTMLLFYAITFPFGRIMGEPLYFFLMTWQFAAIAVHAWKTLYTPVYTSKKNIKRRQKPVDFDQ